MTLAPWPDRPAGADSQMHALVLKAGYEMRLRLAWEQRCRVAVEAGQAVVDCVFAKSLAMFYFTYPLVR